MADQSTKDICTLLDKWQIFFSVSLMDSIHRVPSWMNGEITQIPSLKIAPSFAMISCDRWPQTNQLSTKFFSITWSASARGKRARRCGITKLKTIAHSTCIGRFKKKDSEPTWSKRIYHFWSTLLVYRKLKLQLFLFSPQADVFVCSIQIGRHYAVYSLLCSYAIISSRTSFTCYVGFT